MITASEAKDLVRSNIKITSVVMNHNTTGQSCGNVYYKQVLISEDINLTIECAYHRSKEKNNEVLMELFEIALNKLIF